MGQRTQQALSLAGLISLIGLLITIVTGSVKIGQRDAVLDQKVDKDVFQQSQTSLEHRLGDMQGDIRVIRAAICGRNPGACR